MTSQRRRYNFRVDPITYRRVTEAVESGWAESKTDLITRALAYEADMEPPSSRPPRPTNYPILKWIPPSVEFQRASHRAAMLGLTYPEYLRHALYLFLAAAEEEDKKST